MNKKILALTFVLIIIVFPLNFVNAKGMTLTLEEIYSDPSGWIEIWFTFTKSGGPPIESIDITITSDFVDWVTDLPNSEWGTRDTTDNGEVYYAIEKKSMLRGKGVLAWFIAFYLPDYPLTVTWEALNQKGKVIFSGTQTFTPTA